MSDRVLLTHRFGWHIEVFLGLAILVLTAVGLTSIWLKTGFVFSKWEQLLVAFNIVTGTVALLSGVQKYRSQLKRIRQQIPQEVDR